MKKAAEFDGLEKVHLSDIMTFMAVYARATNLPPHERKTFKTLFGAGGEGRYGHSTMGEQLGRIVDFIRNVSAPAAATISDQRDSGLGLLFGIRDGGDRGLQPSEYAIILFDHFRSLLETYGQIHDQIVSVGRKQDHIREIHVGTSQNFGFHLLPYIFSSWRQVFGERLRLVLEIDNTENLLPLLNSGSLSVFFAYGSVQGNGLPHPTMPNIAFSSFDYDSKMVLVANPVEPVWLNNGHDANADYMARLFSSPTSQPATRKDSKRKHKKTPKACVSGQNHDDTEKKPRYADLDPISLDEVDFGRTELIVAKSLDQPPGLLKEMNRLQLGRSLRIVNSYDECLTFARTGQGLAVVPEVYCKRKLISPFRLTPQGAFTRYIGVYYNRRYNLNEDTFRLLEFFRAYLAAFKPYFRNGDPVGIHKDPHFEEFCASFQLSRDWQEVARRQYPGEWRKPADSLPT